tara:strand:+ start:5507 stop:8776 length:3270 start_codon:yes stop_codon:yes gene_type:complete
MKRSLDNRLQSLIKQVDTDVSEADIVNDEQNIVSPELNREIPSTNEPIVDNTQEGDENVLINKNDNDAILEDNYHRMVAGVTTPLQLMYRATKGSWFNNKASKEDLEVIDELTDEQKILIKQNEKLKKTEKQNVFNTLKKQSAFENNAVEKNAKKAKVNLEEIVGTGEDGKITQADLDAFILKTTSTEKPKDMVYLTDDEVDVEGFFDEYKGEKVGSGIDYNFKRFDTTDAINKGIDATSKLLKKKIDQQKRGELSFNAIKELAATLNIREDLLQAGIGSTFNAEQLLASRHLLVRSAKHLDKLKDKVLAEFSRVGEKNINKIDSKILVEFKAHLHRHSAIQFKLKGLQTEAARALAQFRIPVDGYELLDERKLSNYILESGGVKELVQVAQYIDKLDGQHQKSYFVEGFGTWFKKSYGELYQASLMSSPASLERNFFGQLVMNIIRSADSASAATAGKILDKPITWLFGSKSSDKVYFTESILDIYNFVATFPHALAQGWKAARNNKQEFVGYSEYTKRTGKIGDSDRIQSSAWRKEAFANPDSLTAKIIHYFGNLGLYAFRVTMFGDEVGKASIYQMEKRKQSYKEALQVIENGGSYDDAARGLDAQISSPDAKLLQTLEEQVKEGTFVADLGTIGQFIQRMRNDATFKNIPAGKVLVPFLKTVINIQKEIMKRGPQAVFLKEVKDDLAAGGRKRQIALGKIATGSMMMFYFKNLALEGRITGAGPADPKLRKQLMEDKKWQPFSIKVGDKWVSYAGLEPIGGLMGMAATMTENLAMYNADDAETSNMLLYLAMMPFKYVGELPFMDTFANLVSVLDEVRENPNSDKAGESITRFMGGISQNMVAGVTPIPMPFSGALRQINNYHEGKPDVQFDPSLPPMLRHFDFLYRKFISKMPGSAFENPDKIAMQRNIWGEELKYSGSWTSWIFPYWTSPENFDPVTEQLYNLATSSKRASITMPQKKVSGIKLNDREYNDLLYMMNIVKLNDQNMKSAIQGVIEDHQDQFDKGFYKEGFGVITSTVTDYKNKALESVWAAKYPETYSQIENNDKLIAAGEFSSRLKRIPTTGYREYFRGDKVKDLDLGRIVE